MLGCINGNPYGSTAGDESLKKCLLPLIKKYPSAKFSVDEFGSSVLNYREHSIHLELAFDRYNETEAVTVLDELLSSF